MLKNISWNKNKNHTMFRLPFINFLLDKTYLEKITIFVYICVLRTVQNYENTKIICTNQSM